MSLSTLQDAKTFTHEKQVPRGRALRRLYTAEEFEYLPLKERYELIRGELYRMPKPSAMHGMLTSLASLGPYQFIEEQDLGFCFAAGTRFIIESVPDTVLAPDFSFVAKKASHRDSGNRLSTPHARPYPRNSFSERDPSRVSGQNLSLAARRRKGRLGARPESKISDDSPEGTQPGRFGRGGYLDL